MEPVTNFRSIDQMHTNDFFINRIGWWRPYYELSDEQFTYARLSYKSILNRYAIVECAAGLFTIKRRSLIGRTLLLNHGEDELIGEIEPAVWKRNVKLCMNNGFEATYKFKKLFSRSFTLFNESYGDILEIKQLIWGFKRPFSVTLAPNNQQPGKPDVALLAMIGVHFILVKQAQAAAAG
ncbi:MULTISPECIES: hypothetical protein [unclassified Mucilaginibacter]|uniref:hypothetical protein n=1 Tax=unclassified Mucilaginibacter TaxID=2617802 RepID=UPI00096867D7|nr:MULTISPECIES: hypothetical protein [unclassified Mucilaginibacter]OJW18138.1 MAG: hypothetical protein BGO48_16325 [Mucilaginibacter sp. 44-25]PLW89425.1 MAG: hypothetical protein C0154_11645 [Mucilaginibacter sp.]HEK21611.1 hypothetical protein [Bacteroidota bacterium]